MPAPRRLPLAVLGLLFLAPLAVAHFPATPILQCQGPTRVHEYQLPGGAYVGDHTSETTVSLDVVTQDGNTEDCDGDGIPLDYDGEREWGLGGAWLAVDGRASWCADTAPHHPAFGPITVTDNLLNPVHFLVVADDTSDPTLFPCGDGFLSPVTGDAMAHCVSSCTVTFPPGADGGYWVVVVDGAAGQQQGLSLGVDGHVQS